MTHFTGKVNRYAEACATLDWGTSFYLKVDGARTTAMYTNTKEAWVLAFGIEVLEKLRRVVEQLTISCEKLSKPTENYAT